MRLGIGLGVLFASGGCVINEVRMETRNLPERNPTVYRFDYPLEVLRTRVMAGLAVDEQRRNPIFGRNQRLGGPAIFHVNEAERVSWVKVLQLPENARDLYLSASHEPLWESRTYRGFGDGLPFFAVFHIHFAEINPTVTSVSVTALETEVLNGETWGLGLGGPGTANRYVRVEPTSIEEYVILRYLGGILGVGSMPEVILPWQ